MKSTVINLAALSIVLTLALACSDGLGTMGTITIAEDSSVELFSDNVIIAVSDVQFGYATIRIVLPDVEPIILRKEKVGARQIFEYDGVEYNLNLLEVKYDEVKISIREKSNAE